MNNPRKTFYVLGVSHRVQGEIDFEGSFDDPDYLEILRRIISSERIDFVAEEGGDHTSIAEYVTSELLGAGHYLNVNPEHREDRDIGRLCGVTPLSGVTGETVWFADEIDKMEAVWIDHLVRRTVTKGLLICGFYHTFSVGVKLLESGLVEARTYLPLHKLCNHPKS
jgi:hypothetical protein